MITGPKLILLNFAVGLGTFIQILDTSIANVAVPYIAGNLGVSADQGTWVITAFAASNAIVLPLTGWLSDYFGRVRLFVWSVLLFSIVSLLCGLSTSLTMLVFLRVVQGAVAGSLIPLSQSLIIISNPLEKRGGAMGFWAMIVIVAPVVGPVVGGYLTYVYSWPWIFYINVPIGIFSAVTTWILLRDHESEIVRNPIDWTGLFLLSVAVASLQIMLDKGKDLDWFESNFIIALTIISVISFAYFFIWTYFQKHPIVDLSFFKNRNFLLGTTIVTVGFSLYFGSSVILPLWLQTEQNYTAYWAGIATAPVGIIPFFLARWLGKNMSRFDVRLLVCASYLFFSLGFFLQAMFTTEVSLNQIMLVRLFQGLGLAFFFLPLVQLSLSEIPKEKYASAAGLFNFIRILFGSGFATSLSIQMWTRLQIFHHARLSEFVTTYRHLTQDAYRKLESFSSVFNPAVIDRVIDKNVEIQAYMLSTNDLSWMGAWLFLISIPMIFLFKKVKLSSEEHLPQAE